SAASLDPARAPASSSAWPFGGPQINGGLVVRPSTGSGKSGIYMVAPAYQFIANGAYNAFWGIMLGANLVMRQGYVEPFFYSNVPTGDPLGRKTVLIVNNVDDFQIPNSKFLIVTPRFHRASRLSAHRLRLFAIPEHRIQACGEREAVGGRRDARHVGEDARGGFGLFGGLIDHREPGPRARVL